MYYYITLRGKWESDFEFDHFDLDQFDHASLTTKLGKMW